MIFDIVEFFYDKIVILIVFGNVWVFFGDWRIVFCCNNFV